MKYSLLLTLVLLTFTAQASDSFTIYLTRHAEKQGNHKNPKLTECGLQRAKQLASMLKKVKITQVYSTKYNRTMATAKPIANQQAIAIKQYSPTELAQFAQKLLSKKENALVVGHSNTTPQLSALLSELDVKEMAEKEYRNLYQIHVNSSGKTLTLLTQPLICHSEKSK